MSCCGVLASKVSDDQMWWLLPPHNDPSRSALLETNVPSLGEFHFSSGTGKDLQFFGQTLDEVVSLFGGLIGKKPHKSLNTQPT